MIKQIQSVRDVTGDSLGGVSFRPHIVPQSDADRKFEKIKAEIEICLDITERETGKTFLRGHPINVMEALCVKGVFPNRELSRNVIGRVCNYYGVSYQDFLKYAAERPRMVGE